MLRIVRCRVAALAVLAAFLIGQPAALCAALCAVEQHHATMPDMGGMPHKGVGAPGACHSGISGAIRHDLVQALSPMAPARAVRIAAAAERRVTPVRVHSASPRTLFRTADPPPPRLI
jgi:hypothetical protein